MLLSFVATTWLLAMLPGIGQALLLRQTLTYGPRVAMLTILGNSTGLLIWSTAASVGLSAALLADPRVSRLLFTVGGAVLIVIGLRTLWGVLRGSAAHPVTSAAAATQGRGQAYLAGLTTNLSNPKAGVFAISLLPAFAASTRFWPTVELGVVWATVSACWYPLFVFLVSKGSAFIIRPRQQRILGVVTGLVLVTVGTAVALGG